MPEISQTVRISSRISASGGASRRFGSTLFLTTEDTLAPSGSGRVQSFANLAEMSIFPSSSAPYVAGTTYYAQQPFPPPLKVGRWVDQTVGARLDGTDDHESLDDIKATSERRVGVGDEHTASVATVIGTGSPTIKLGAATAVSVTGLGGLTTHAAVAARLQVAIRTSTSPSGAGYDIDYDADLERYVIKAPLGTTEIPTIAGTMAAPTGLDTLTQSGSGVSGSITSGSVTWTPDFTDDESLSDIAATVQSGARTALSNTVLTVTYNAVAQRFEVRAGVSSGSPNTLSSRFTGTVGVAMGLDDGSLTTGQTAETVTQALNAIEAVDDDWYFLALEDTHVDTATVETVSSWTETQRKLAMLDTHASAVLTGDDAEQAVETAKRGRERTAFMWSESTDYKALGLAGRFGSVNFTGSDTLITAKFKALANTTGDTLTSAQRDELDDLRINYTTLFGSSPVVGEGVTTRSGTYIDTRIWLDWLVQTVQSDVYDLLIRTPRIPQTGGGLALLEDTVNDVLRRGIRNGGIAPGTVSNSVRSNIRTVTGNDRFDGLLPNGYLIYIAPLSTLSDTDLANRNVPPIYIWVKGSGAIHYVDIDLTFN